MRSIKVLPESIRNSLRSGIILSDLTRVVEELVFNSLDAGATKVIVAVGVGTNYIKITDNGCGITRDGLVLLGERYATSKFEQLSGLNTVPETFGFRGEALSSISDLSLLQVVTKAHGMPNGYCKVIKCSKCLYLGINDDRQDVGTTVVVRDLFYNQPVRRRHLQSSPKKVLYSVKESILRIALVHLRTCFKVIDTESGDELLSLYPSSSPLPLLVSSFGTEVSSSLHKLDLSDGKLKLSGFISGPCETFSVKAFQYFYINSRYISKGPIHKLLNQLATDSDLLKADIRSESGKRNRCQACPTYILNLSCPRAHYDLSFEPTKTCVEFKEWDPVFTFIKKAVSCFWSQDAHTSKEDNIWNGADTLSTKDDALNDCGLPKKMRLTWSHPNSIVLSSPQLEMPREEPKHMSYSKYSGSKSQRNAIQSEDYGTGMDFACLPDNLLNFSPRSLPECKSPIPQPNSCVSYQHICSKTKCRGADTLSTKDDALNDCGFPKKRRVTWSHPTSIVLSSPQLDMPREEPKHMSYSKYSGNKSQRNVIQSEDYGIGMDFACLPDNLLNFSPRSLPECKSPIPQPNRCVSFQDICSKTKCRGELSSIHIDHLSDAKWSPNTNLVVNKSPDIQFHFNNGENFDDHVIKPFLRSCSSHMDMSPVVKSKRGDDQFRFQADGSTKWLHLNNIVDNGEFENIIQGCEPWLDKNATVWSPPRMISPCNLGIGSPFLSKGSFDSLLTDRDCFTENTSPWASPVASNQRSISSRRPLKLDWSPLTFVEKTRMDDVSKRDFKLRRDEWFDLFADEEAEKDIFDFDNMRYSSSQEGYVSCTKHVRNSHNNSSLFPQQCDFLYGKHETCIPVVSSSEITQSRLQDKKPSRSHSAPPSYRGKEKFVALNSLVTDKSGNSHNETLHSAPVQETSNLKHVQKSPGVDHLVLEEGPTNDLQSKARHNKKKIIDKAEISDDEGEVAHCLDVYNSDSDFTSRDNESTLDFGEKWRDGCSWASSIEKKPENVLYQDSILDISSGILHLSGDSLTPKSISKKCLDDSKVLQQVDKKFIPIVGGGILALIDQHAADERIRLEDLRKKVLSGKMKTICYLDAEQELVLPEIGYQLLKNYSEQIQKWGWICNFHAQSSASFKKNLNFLHNQPSVATLVAVPCILGVNLTDVDLLEFLKQLADTDGSSIMPPGVLRVLNTKACRGAIMFGDALLPSECSLIVEELKQTSLCFQCAHGRPTTVPLVDLVMLHKQIAKLGNINRGSSGPWHGLSRHRPSLERATQRLGQS